jgi:putative FmdB family regulatory protein
MPTYEYQCQECSTTYEEQRTLAQADQPSRCPECESPRVKRKLSMFFTFSPGSGQALSAGGCACSSGGRCACQAAGART